MQTLTRCICEPIQFKNHKQALKERTNIINKLKREYPKSRITYDNGFVMCEYREGVGVN
jgi:hypothetical protein